MSETTKADEAKCRAESLFKKQRPLATAGPNTKAIDAARTADSEKTAKLRAFRLSKEQSD